MNIRSFSAGDFAENTYLFTCDDRGTAVVVDPGAGAGPMLETVAREDLSVAAVLLTHAHLDHVEGLAEVMEAVSGDDGAGGEIPIYLHPAGRSLYDSLSQQAEMFGASIPDPPAPDRGLEHGQTLTFGNSSLQVRHAPGHAPGHVIFWDENAGVAFVGDVVFRGSIGRTDLPGGDFRQLMDSIREQVLTLPDDTRLLTGHGPETTVGEEREGNPFLIPHYGGELA